MRTFFILRMLLLVEIRIIAVGLKLSFSPPEDPEGRQAAEDREQGGVVVAHPAEESPSNDDNLAPASATPTSGIAAEVHPEVTENNNSGPSGRKWRLCRQLSRTKESSCSRAVEGLMDQEVFVSIQGNQFRRNGMGDFGTFFY